MAKALEIPLPQAPKPVLSEERGDTSLIDGLFRSSQRVHKGKTLKHKRAVKRRTRKLVKNVHSVRTITLKRKKMRKQVKRSEVKKIRKAKFFNRISKLIKIKKITPRRNNFKNKILKKIKQKDPFERKVRRKHFRISKQRNPRKLSLKKKKTLHTKFKHAVQQGLLRGKIARHVENAEGFLHARKVEKAKKEYSKGLIAYFHMPEHEEKYYLKLKSLLKRIERAELMPHHDFHHHAHQLMNLKRSGKKASRETAQAVHGWKRSLESQSSLTIPRIREAYAIERINVFGEQETSNAPEDSSVPRDSSVPTVQISPQEKGLIARKEYERVVLDDEQAERLRKIQKLKSEKEKLKREMEKIR